MHKIGDTLTSLQMRRNPAKNFGWILIQTCLWVGLLFLPISVGRGLAYDDPFNVPLKSLSKIDPANVVQFKLVSVTTNGTQSSATLELETRGGFKLYDHGLRFEYKSSATLNTPVVMNHQAHPAAKVIQDPFYNEPRAVHDKGARFSVTSEVPIDETGVVRVRFEACSVNTCLLPAYFVISARQGETSRPEPKEDSLVFPSALSPKTPPRVSTQSQPLSDAVATPAATAATQPTPIATITSQLSASPTAKPTPAPPEISLTDSVTAEVQRSLTARSWLLFPALFLAGLLMNLTPCVYPMIPITLNVLGHSIHSKKDLGAKEYHPVVPALFYVLGIILSYAGMGVIAGMTGSLFGGLLQNKLFNFALAALMFALGLSMLGVIDLSRLQALGNRIPLSKKSPHAAVLTMGAVSGLVAAPCTGPVLSMLLVLVGQSKDPVYGFTLMGVFAAGFGAPYLALGFLSHEMRRVPRAGRLMNLVKNIFSALMFALSFYYLKTFLGQIPLFGILYAKPSLTGLCTITALTILFLVWQRRSAEHPIATLGAQIGLSILALWMTLSAIKGFVASEAASLPSFSRINDPVELPNPDSQMPERINWYKDWNEAVQAAQLEKKGLVVDAWAQWCAACLKMDAEVWNESGVEALLSQHFIALKVDFTESTPTSEDLAKRWDLSGLPAVGIYPAGSDFQKQPPILFREAVTVSQLHQAVQKLFNGEIIRKE